MSAGPFRRGRRLFSTAAVLLIVVAAAHTAGHVPLLLPKHPLPGALGTMAAERTPLGMGMAPSVLDIHLALVLTMSVTFVALGLLNLVVAAAWVSALVALYAHYRIPPPLISAALVEVVLLSSLLATRPARGVTAW